MSDAPREFTFTRYPARQGMAWLAAAYAMFRVHRKEWVLLVVGYFFVLVLVRMVPLVGPYAMTLMKPVFAVGLLAAAWTQERGGTPAFRLLFQGFRTNLVALLAIGVFFVAGITVAVFSSALVDGGKLVEIVSSGKPVSEEQLADALSERRVQLGMLFAAFLALPVLIATWWAPALVVFQDAKAGAALYASLRAALANWPALAMYGIGVFFYGVVVPGLITGILALVVPPPGGAWIMLGLLVPYSLFFTATLHLSDYVSYRDVFHAGEKLAPLASDTRA
ncbi:MAG: BPSS1780 family membrane protein [Burkholderiales bacterium]